MADLRSKQALKKDVPFSAKKAAAAKEKTVHSSTDETTAENRTDKARKGCTSTTT